MLRYIRNIFVPRVSLLDLLHSDLVILILSWLSHSHLAKMRQVSRRYRTIVERMIDLDESDFLTCCEQGRYLSMWRHLNTRKVDLDGGLIAACRGGQYTVVWLLINGCHPDPTFSYSTSPPWIMAAYLRISDEALSCAAANGHIRIVDMLFDGWRYRDRHIFSVMLKVACSHGQREIVEYLLEKNILADIDRSAIKAACKRGYLSIVKIFARWSIPPEWWSWLALKSTDDGVIEFCNRKASEINIVVKQ